MPKKYTLVEALTIAQNACDYAAQHILHGSTQTANNDLSFDYFISHLNGISKVRSLAKDKTIHPRTIEAMLLPPTLLYYEHHIKVSSKFSLGNCQEQAFQSLDYIVRNVPEDFNAEIFAIAGGDHAFLVLNRIPHSIPANPFSWGQGAVICDPWAKKVYPAKNYLIYLKNLKKNSLFDSLMVLASGKSRLRVENFDPKIHEVVLAEMYGLRITANTIRNMRNDQEIIKSRIKFVFTKIIAILGDYKILFESEKSRLILQHGDTDFKALILADKVSAIEDLVKLAESHLLLLNDKYHNATELMETFKIKLAELLHGFINIQFTQDEQNKLFSYRNTSRITLAMKKFGFLSQTETNLGNTLKKIDLITASCSKMT